MGTDAYGTIKLFPGKTSVYGVTGENCTGSLKGLAWLQSGRNKDCPPPAA